MQVEWQAAELALWNFWLEAVEKLWTRSFLMPGVLYATYNTKKHVFSLLINKMKLGRIFWLWRTDDVSKGWRGGDVMGDVSKE